MATNDRHRQDKDRIIGAWLQGTASRHASQHGWKGPEDETALDAAIAELREIATVGRTFRTDLLAREAGICLGASRLKEITARLAARKAELLLNALDGAEAELVEQVAQATYEHLSPAAVGEPQFARPRAGS